MKGGVRAVLRWLEVVIVCAAMVVALASSFAQTTRAVPAKGTVFTCRPVAVWDGDGPIWCAEGPRIRLANINARELDGSCRRGANCVVTSGIAARSALVDRLGGARGKLPSGHVRVASPALRCRSQGPDRYNRTLAACADRRGDIGSSMIAEGVVAPYRR